MQLNTDRTGLLEMAEVKLSVGIEPNLGPLLVSGTRILTVWSNVGT